MDYKEKYEQALAKAKDMLNYKEVRQEDMEYLFSELKESEDEKIRKAISQCVEDMRGQFEKLYRVHHKDAIAWLEKQKPVEFCEEDEKIRKAISIYLDWLDGRKDCAPRGEYSIRDMVVWLEKKGANSVSVTKGNTSVTNVKVISHPTVTDFDGGKCTTASTTIEPKFKAGDWITNGDYTWKIVEVKPLDYILQSQDGNIVDDTISYVDEQFHSFTIEDAKDGDVLASNRGDIILARKVYKSQPFAYCGINNEEFMCSDGHTFWHEVCYHPATKEQRDLLFTKMKDAGYEWDIEKKKMKW